MSLFSKRWFSGFATIGMGLVAACVSTQDASAQQSIQSPQLIQQATPNRAKRTPFKLSPVAPASFQECVEGIPMPEVCAPNEFLGRHVVDAPIAVAPMGMTFTPEQVHGPMQLPSPGPKDEYLIDGSDRNFRAYVDKDWKVHGLDTEDTIGHFDTLDGRRIATPSNRVAIYAPRFAAVRRVSDISGSSTTSRLASANDRMETVTRRSEDLTSSTMQNLQAQRHKIAQRPLAFLDRTRGVTNETVLHVAQLGVGYKAYENLQLVKFGRLELSEGTRLNIATQSANAWTDNLRVLIDSSTTKLIVVNDAASAQDVTMSETEGDNPTLRVAKLASRITAKPGDEVDFTIRFDNVGNQAIGNVTIIDNLTARLEYVEDSAECSVPGNLVMTENEAGSVTLRWEIEDPLKIGKGGIIRFKCRVR
ncbi:DUF11 domain-containing protein [bacterium]|nr:DUF11 domain-containing protein [bacterium]